MNAQVVIDYFILNYLRHVYSYFDINFIYNFYLFQYLFNNNKPADYIAKYKAYKDIY